MIGTRIAAPLVTATAGDAAAGGSNVGLGAVVLTLAAAAILIWVSYLVLASRRRRRPAPEETPLNLQPYMSDDELETSRLTRVLGTAVVTAAVLAVSLPVYYINESKRQAEAAEAIEDVDVEEGERWFERFECIRCHGPDAGGGNAEFVEKRSGLTAQWSAPSLNDVFYRYTAEEVRFFVVYGRSGTPMPANGLEGGGALTFQEVDQVLAYLHSIQVSQSTALDKIEGAVTQALRRIENGADTLALLIAEQSAVLADITEAPKQFEVIGDFADRIKALLSSDGTCTNASAALVGLICASAGADSDRDGITDSAELALNQMSTIVDSTMLVRRVAEDGVVSKVPDAGAFPNLFGLALDPNDGFSMAEASGEPVADLRELNSFLRDLANATLNLSVITERQDRFLEAAQKGLDFLILSDETKAWEVDFEAVAEAADLNSEEARRAVGLFNAYCSRCHSGGYSAGVAYEQGPGTGAWAPALTNGRSLVQFPDVEDHVQFVIRGSELAVNYGINGIGRGWMPAFGQLLSEQDIRLIVAFERTL